MLREGLHEVALVRCSGGEFGTLCAAASFNIKMKFYNACCALSNVECAFCGQIKYIRVVI